MKFTHISASLEDDPAETAKAIDGDPKAQSGLSNGKSLARNATAVLQLAQPISGMARLTLHQPARGSIGRFRLSAASAEGMALAVTDVVAPSLKVPAEKRTPEQRDTVLLWMARFNKDANETLKKLRQAEQTLAGIKAVEVPVLRELPVAQARVTKILYKGSYLSPTEAVQPGVPETFGAWPPKSPRNRLGLVDWLFSPDNPLTARVAVNRAWAQLFGTGIVETEEDFGTQGQLPTHPELLDWLAVEFRENGWDHKALLKTIMSSATYRQSSRTTADRLAQDPRGRWLSRYPRRQSRRRSSPRPSARLERPTHHETRRPERLSAAAGRHLARRLQRRAQLSHQHGPGPLPPRPIHHLAPDRAVSQHGDVRRAEPRTMHPPSRADKYATPSLRDAE